MVRKNIKIRERLITEHKKTMDNMLEDPYKKSAQQDLLLVKDWDVVSGDRVD